ncbi:hypothetical protein OAK95_02560 [Akkermansiaceae bacterium]|nr:hypothetical protein [Akkermansiaceae bacterium]
MESYAILQDLLPSSPAFRQGVVGYLSSPDSQGVEGIIGIINQSPFSPLCSGPRRLQSPPAKSNFLAVRQPTKPEAWENSKHKKLAELIKAEDRSCEVIVGGDFNEWTDGLVMRSLAKETKLKNSTTEKSIDHILFSTRNSVKLLEAKRDWGPKNQNDKNLKADGCLSDHPWVYCELEIPASVGSE